MSWEGQGAVSVSISWRLDGMAQWDDTVNTSVSESTKTWNSFQCQITKVALKSVCQ